MTLFSKTLFTADVFEPDFHLPAWSFQTVTGQDEQKEVRKMHKKNQGCKFPF